LINARGYRFVDSSTSESLHNPSVSALDHAPAVRTKRHQIQNACVHCKRLHAKCNEERPCRRCEENGLADSCVDAPKKQRGHRGRRKLFVDVIVLIAL
jgi:hypothetical protein